MEQLGQGSHIVRTHFAQHVHGDVAHHHAFGTQQGHHGLNRGRAPDFAQSAFGGLLHPYAAVGEVLDQRRDGALQPQISGLKRGLSHFGRIIACEPAQDILLPVHRIRFVHHNYALRCR